MAMTLEELVDHTLYVDPYSGGTIEQTQRKVEGVEKLLRAVIAAMGPKQLARLEEELRK